ncbi:sugar transferase [Schinkia azotoformans]|nr:sugar transferase [Schinkia azotoformans]MEC1696772.1 sugar transferase [Schinkia azotoformans]MEC1725019.1 sugar transferase [Schinkia azotoformans]MEC1741746.1 sugar transferase [Schinkia azotoformans]MEC1766576.1 sugar transferase [Schinkia azotoformans]MEC1781333.1 sugar transferase [Schinkia azotoformans]
MGVVKKFNLFVKRLMDVLGSGFGILVTFPLFIIVIILIRVTMPGPIFFKQERIGMNKKPFKILKFRSMKVDKEAEKTLDFSKDKERLTTLGKILRRTKIDELPQLINVLFGDMSLVGPRPTVIQQVENYTEHQLKRLSMRPGMTGLAQVNGNIAIPWEQRIIYDIEYIEKFSIALDFRVLFKTVAIVLFGEENFVKVRDNESQNRSVNH